VSLTGFTFIADRLPNDCEVCLIVETGGHLSAACWDTGTKWTQDGEPGVYDKNKKEASKFVSLNQYISLL